MIYSSCQSLTQMGKKLYIIYIANYCIIIIIEKLLIKIFCFVVQFQIRIQSYEKQAVEEDPFKKKWDSEFSRNNGPMYRSRSQQELWVQVMNSCPCKPFEISFLTNTLYDLNVTLMMTICDIIGGVKLQTQITFNILPKQLAMTHILDINRGLSQRLLRSEISFYTHQMQSSR